MLQRVNKRIILKWIILQILHRDSYRLVYTLKMRFFVNMTTRSGYVNNNTNLQRVNKRIILILIMLQILHKHSYRLVHTLTMRFFVNMTIGSGWVNNNINNTK